jgi:hypothetical protein
MTTREFDHEAARPPEPSKALDPDAFPRAAFKLADLLDELAKMGPKHRQNQREKVSKKQGAVGSLRKKKPAKSAY